MPGATADSSGTPWYKDAVFYELHVRSFFDANGDGVGDFAGLIRKLDYLQELGVTALWLLPFYPSPLRDDGYDISDHLGVHPGYGSLREVRRFIREAHRRGLRVVTELVCNHTSDQHPWFQRARRAPPGSRERAYYVWSDRPDRYPEARVIFKDFERSNWSWDAVAGAYYWHRFYSHQPDLNFDHAPVRKAILGIADFWFSLGVDGLRLDAVPYLFERDGTSCESLPETHAFLRTFRRFVDARHRDRLLIAEANQWPEDAAAFFGDGDECQMCFHFPLMPRLFLGVRMEDRFPIVDILAQTPSIPANAQWGLFLRNHDELTLEMVTDEERDLMYRAYTKGPEALRNLGIRRRLAPLLGNNRRRIELMHALLLSLPGTPFLYYGDEIGMGDNVRLGDRNAVRTPMQWTAERNGGFSAARARDLFLPPVRDPTYHYRSLNVESQLADPQSLLRWMRRIIGIRRQHRAFAEGAFELVRAENRKVLAFVRRSADERILVVANLSRYVQSASLELAGHRGLVPVELFGGNALPEIDAVPYTLTLGPHSFYWLALSAPAPRSDPTVVATAPKRLRLNRRAPVVTDPTLRLAIQRELPAFLARQPWFEGRDRGLRRAELKDLVEISRAPVRRTLAIVELTYREGEPESWLLVLGVAVAEHAVRIAERTPEAIIAEAEGASERWLVYEASADTDLGHALTGVIAARRRRAGKAGTLVARRTSAFTVVARSAQPSESAELARVEQRVNTVALGERTVTKVFRRLGEGPNPELELGRALTENVRFANVPPLAGSIEYVPARGEPLTLALLRGYVPADGDLGAITAASLRSMHVNAARTGAPDPRATPDTFRPDLERCALLAVRVAELHLALASIDEPPFRPEAYTKLRQRSLYQSLHTLAVAALDALRTRRRSLPPPTVAHARAVLAREAALDRSLRWLLTTTIDCVRIRVHGDLHLGQVLVAAGDLVFIDLEGEPWRSIGERRLKRSSLRDVAALLASYEDVAVQAANEATVAGAEERLVRALTGRWVSDVRRRLLDTYLGPLAGSRLVPQDPAIVRGLLGVLLIERALGEVWGALSNGTRSLEPPVRRLAELLRSGKARA